MECCKEVEKSNVYTLCLHNHNSAITTWTLLQIVVWVSYWVGCQQCQCCACLHMYQRKTTRGQVVRPHYTCTRYSRFIGASLSEPHVHGAAVRELYGGGDGGTCMFIRPLHIIVQWLHVMRAKNMCGVETITVYHVHRALCWISDQKEKEKETTDRNSGTTGTKGWQEKE